MRGPKSLNCRRVYNDLNVLVRICMTDLLSALIAIKPSLRPVRRCDVSGLPDSMRFDTSRS